MSLTITNENAHQLATLPVTLQTLTIQGLSTLHHWPPELNALTHLRVLNIINTPLEDLSGIQYLENLSILRLSNLNLTGLPRTISTLRELRMLEVNRCPRIQYLPSFHRCSSLHQIVLTGISVGEIPRLPPALQYFSFKSRGLPNGEPLRTDNLGADLPHLATLYLRGPITQLPNIQAPLYYIEIFSSLALTLPRILSYSTLRTFFAQSSNTLILLSEIRNIQERTRFNFNAPIIEADQRIIEWLNANSSRATGQLVVQSTPEDTAANKIKLYWQSHRYQKKLGQLCSSKPTKLAIKELRSHLHHWLLSISAGEGVIYQGFRERIVEARTIPQLCRLGKVLALAPVISESAPRDFPFSEKAKEAKMITEWENYCRHTGFTEEERNNFLMLARQITRISLDYLITVTSDRFTQEHNRFLHSSREPTFFLAFSGGNRLLWLTCEENPLFLEKPYRLLLKHFGKLCRVIERKEIRPICLYLYNLFTLLDPYISEETLAHARLYDESDPNLYYKEYSGCLNPMTLGGDDVEDLLWEDLYLEKIGEHSCYCYSREDLEQIRNGDCPYRRTPLDKVKVKEFLEQGSRRSHLREQLRAFRTPSISTSKETHQSNEWTRLSRNLHADEYITHDLVTWVIENRTDALRRILRAPLQQGHTQEIVLPTSSDTLMWQIRLNEFLEQLDEQSRDAYVYLLANTFKLLAPPNEELEIREHAHVMLDNLIGQEAVLNAISS